MGGVELRFLLFFFFSSRRRHTSWNCDWSSDVCSSDLAWWRPRVPSTRRTCERAWRCCAVSGWRCGSARTWSPGKATWRAMTSGGSRSGAMRILDRIDPTPLLEPAKWVVGFSDVTALHGLLNRAGLVTLHAPLVTTLGRATPAAVEHLRALLFGERQP